MLRQSSAAMVTSAAVMLLGWFVGLAWLLWLPELPDAIALLTVASAAALGLLISLGTTSARMGRCVLANSTQAWFVLTLGIASTLASFAWVGWRLQEHLIERLPPAFEGREFTLNGCVATIPTVSADGMRFVVEVRQARVLSSPDRGAQADLVNPSSLRRVVLSWMREVGDADLLSSAAPRVSTGECWRWPVRLKRPRGAMNPHARDGELWALEAGVGAVGHVVTRSGLSSEHAPRRLSMPSPYAVQAWRHRTRDAIERHVPDSRTAGVLAALTVGDQSAIDRADWDLFRQTGVAHLMAISGLHVTLFAALAAWGIGVLWRRMPRACLMWPAPRAGLVLGAMLATGYAVFSGWGVPSQRTVIMLGIVAAVRLGGWRWPWPWVMALAAAAVTLMHPWAVLQPGFWLSFVAVAMLIASASQPSLAGGERHDEKGPRSLRMRLMDHLRVHAHAQMIATVGLAPLGVLFFQQVSGVGFVANLLAIPVVTLVVTPLALAGVLVPPLWGLGAWVTQALVAVLEPLARLPSAWWHVAVAPTWALALGVLGGVVAVLPLPLRWRLSALLLCLPMMVPVVHRPSAGRFEAIALDVGQGTAVLLRTQHRLLIYDTGPASPGGGNAGERQLLPLLRARGETRVDRLMLSHRDVDHVGGAHAIVTSMLVSAIHSSLETTHPLRLLGLPHERCVAGQHWVWDGVRFDVLHPTAQDYVSFSRSANAVSCVLRVTDAEGRTLLLSGDVGSAQEWAMLQRHAQLRSDVLVVAHHGSRHSTTDAWLRAVAPRDAVIQAGYRNRFGHPHPDVEARLAAHSVRVHRTDRCGAWTRQPNGEGVCERERRRRVWHDDLGYRLAWQAQAP